MLLLEALPTRRRLQARLRPVQAMRPMPQVPQLEARAPQRRAPLMQAMPRLRLRRLRLARRRRRAKLRQVQAMRPMPLVPRMEARAPQRRAPLMQAMPRLRLRRLRLRLRLRRAKLLTARAMQPRAPQLRRRVPVMPLLVLVLSM